MTSPFAPLALSKRLAEAGCVSESGFVWADVPALGASYAPVHAFRPEDFLGPTQAARENCKKWWPDSDTCVGCQEPKNHGMHYDGHPFEIMWEHRRVVAMDQPDVKSFWKYIEDTGVGTGREDV